ncbi:hypothetical protein [Dactylosporangium sp. NPDC050588]|uniref:hypothetical protein n=1 Tax=Dactylosporangium sp. NPDC050588 TaxID=3157211 RepID=UPI0033F484E1
MTAEIVRAEGPVPPPHRRARRNAARAGRSGPTVLGVPGDPRDAGYDKHPATQPFLRTKMASDERTHAEDGGDRERADMAGYAWVRHDFTWQHARSWLSGRLDGRGLDGRGLDGRGLDIGHEAADWLCTAGAA